MVRSTDIGSMPPNFDLEEFWNGANSYGPFMSYIYPNFEKIVVGKMIDKYKAGLDVPTYPQFRDMNEMFIRNIDGLRKNDNGSYSITGPLSITEKKAKIAEVSALEKNFGEIAEAVGGKADLRVCITGPATLAWQLNKRTGNSYSEFGRVLSSMAAANVFDGKHGRVSLLSIDEPIFGVNDPTVDYGSEGREKLLKAWDGIAAAIPKGVQTVLHLHNTGDPLFWDSNVDIIESHTNDLIYTTPRTKRLLEEHDKFLKAPITPTVFDEFIKRRIGSDDQTSVSVEWEKIRKREADPISYLEESAVMSKRLAKIMELFGEERVPFAGPECGPKGYFVGDYFFYDCALEQLRRAAETVSNFNTCRK